MGESECCCPPEVSITPANVIEVQGLTKRYGDLLAVNHINFEVKSGEMFGFLGPNGAGKTTIVRMLTGVIKANAGSAFIMGYKAGSLKAKQRIGVVPEFIRGMLRELNQKGRVIFLTTHDMEEANQLCDRIAIINHGKITALDTPQRLRSTINRLQSVGVVTGVSMTYPLVLAVAILLATLCLCSLPLLPACLKVPRCSLR
jgi:ABC-type multidrug transport system ATPase subunit